MAHTTKVVVSSNDWMKRDSPGVRNCGEERGEKQNGFRIGERNTQALGKEVPWCSRAGMSSCDRRSARPNAGEERAAGQAQERGIADAAGWGEDFCAGQSGLNVVRVSEPVNI